MTRLRSAGFSESACSCKLAVYKYKPDVCRSCHLEFDGQTPRSGDRKRTSDTRASSDNQRRSGSPAKHRQLSGRDATRSPNDRVSSTSDRPIRDAQAPGGEQLGAALAGVSAVAIQILALQQALDASVAQQRNLQEMVDHMYADVDQTRGDAMRFDRSSRRAWRRWRAKCGGRRRRPNVFTIHLSIRRDTPSHTITR
jgi:hypothetical protein